MGASSNRSIAISEQTGWRVWRRLAWIALAAPIVLYLVVFPIEVRLGRRPLFSDIPSERGLSIWREMGHNLPGSGADTLVRAGFWIACVAFLAGTLWLTWLALDREPVTQDESPLVLSGDPAESDFESDHTDASFA
jgi:hypothetical protein